MPRHGEVIELLKERGLRDQVKVVVGGAPLTRTFAEDVGADAYAANAMEALSEIRKLVGIGA
jgi:methanogenic corrinoid protein MtbC1